MFCWLRFKFVFYQILWPFLSHLGLHLTPFFRNRLFRKSLQKKGHPHLKTGPYPCVRWLPETPPLIILYKGRRLAGALNSVQFNSIQAQFNSNSIPIELELEMAVWVGFEIEKILEHGWLSLVSIGKGWCQKCCWCQNGKSTLLMIWHARWLKPGEFDFANVNTSHF